MDQPTQAVILAGGRGTRLKPLTDTIPKAMIPFHGKPFVEYLVELLREQGFEKILFLLGYLPHVIQNYFGDGRSFGVHIDYCISDVDFDTGRRMKLAEQQLDPCFLLMYSDNYWPMRMRLMWEHFIRTKALAQLTVYANRDAYRPRNNVLIDDQGMVLLYDKRSELSELQGVDIGFALVRKEVLTLLPDENVSFEEYVYPILAGRRQLAAFVTDHRYYSVSTHDRLPVTEAFLKIHRAIILDRDGVLNRKAPDGDYVTDPQEFEWLPGAKKATKLLKEAGYTVIVVTNQAGIGRGKMTAEALEAIHDKLTKDLSEIGAEIDAIYVCPHDWYDGCDCRKPKPGMLFQAQHDFNLDLSKVIFVGDDVRDQEAGDAAGCHTILVNERWPLHRIVEEKVLGDTFSKKEKNR